MAASIVFFLHWALKTRYADNRGESENIFGCITGESLYNHDMATKSSSFSTAPKPTLD